jgi:hypothetical protein
MRLRRAVPKISSRSSVPPGLPVYKVSPALNSSKATLPQVLILLHFNSPRINSYKKPGRGPLLRAYNFANSSLPTRRPAAHAGISATPFISCLYFMTCGHPGVGVPAANDGFRFSLGLLNRQLSIADADRVGTANFRLLGGDFSLRRYLLASLLLSSVLPSPPHPGAIHA